MKASQASVQFQGALTLTPEQQLLMPGPSKPTFGATGDDMASLQGWFQAMSFGCPIPKQLDQGSCMRVQLNQP